MTDRLLREARRNYERVFLEEWGHVPSSRTNADVHNLAHSVPKLCDALEASEKRVGERDAEIERLRDSLELVLETVRQSQTEHDHSAFPLLERAAREALARPAKEVRDAQE